MTTSAPEPSSLTSFSQLFEHGTDELTIKAIEIPLIQRDYAQGRQTEVVNRIRESFIKALCDALKPAATPVDLDFVFGDVQEDGSFSPLDGQQRLTTLFLLHCYLNWRTENLKDQAWQKFSYATRPSARAFCEFLVSEKCNPDFSKKLSEWIKDQADYLPTWQYDPTIQSMLVVLDALHERFKNAEKSDFQEAWLKLTDVTNPAIRFHVLPIKAGGLTDELYIKMNSRGKPLTQFENFKAHFEDILKNSHEKDKVDYFSKKVDTSWSDILWIYQGTDNLIDDEFMRYFRFITEICAWNSGIDLTRLEDLAEQVYSDPDKKTENLQFLFDAFDVWIEQNEKDWKVKDIKAEFEQILTKENKGASVPLLMFNPLTKEGVDLFEGCCRSYGSKEWGLAHTLMLYAVLLKFIHNIDETDFSKRLRILRNLIAASGNDDVRTEYMQKLLPEVRKIIVGNSLIGVKIFNQVQRCNELAKAKMLRKDSALKTVLNQLEDHDLLRGGLTAFDFDPDEFKKRAETFISVFNNDWKLVTGALLAKGDYSRQVSGKYALGTSNKSNAGYWRELFRGKAKESTHPMLEPLKALLDDVSSGTTLQTIIDDYLNTPSTPKNWRYYFVKYEAMRTGASGIYTINSSGYQVCMLDKEVLRSYYYDPYLLAIVKLSGISEENIAEQNGKKWACCFYGYADIPRKLILNSGLKIQCVNEGWKIEAPVELITIFTAIFTKYGITTTTDGYLYTVAQTDGIDTEDRIKKAAILLKELVNKEL